MESAQEVQTGQAEKDTPFLTFLTRLGAELCVLAFDWGTYIFFFLLVFSLGAASKASGALPLPPVTMVGLMLSVGLLVMFRAAILKLAQLLERVI